MQTEQIAKLQKLLELEGLKLNTEVFDLIRFLELYDEFKKVHQKIRIKYADNEYGREAKKLGLPEYSYDGDAGLDLPVVLPVAEHGHGLQIFPGDRVMLHTGMVMEFPKGYWGRITHRSSTENRSRLRVIEGTIDDYRGEIFVQVHNMNTFPLHVEHGHKLAQLILCNTCSFTIEEAQELRPSRRGANGFGSTGK